MIWIQPASTLYVVEQLQKQITLLELKLADRGEKLAEMEKENEILPFYRFR